MKNKLMSKLISLKKVCKRAFLSVLAVSIAGLFASSAFAMTPTLSLYSTGNNSVQITVNGDSNSSVIFYYYANNSGSLISTTLGSTNQSGYFSTTINNNSYNISQNTSVYVMVNGTQSNSVSWPYNNNNNGGNISLDRSSLYLNSGQNSTVNIYGGGNSYYISSNSNSGVATASISGNTVNVYAYSSGTTNISICSNNSNNGCVTLYVSVGGNNYNYQYPPVSLSQKNVSVGIGQSVSVWISGGTGTYYVSSNSNQNIAAVSMTGNTINVYGRQNGYDDVTICSSIIQNRDSAGYAYNSCADLTINVGSGYGYNNQNNYYPNQNTYYPNSGVYTGGVFLSQVPYTGSGSNSGVVIFVIALWIWSASIAYFIYKKIGKPSFANTSASRSKLIARFKQENLRKRLGKV